MIGEEKESHMVGVAVFKRGDGAMPRSMKSCYKYISVDVGATSGHSSVCILSSFGV